LDKTSSAYELGRAFTFKKFESLEMSLHDTRRAGFLNAQPKICQFTLNDAENNWVFVNPDHVISIFPRGTFTEIVTTQRAGLLFPKNVSISVKESAVDVVERLSAARA
jgi:hypothetical protein